MNRTSDATLPMEQVYSLSEYNVQQQRAGGAEQIADARYGLESARKDLKAATCRRPISSYSRAKFKGANGADRAGRGPRARRSWSRTCAAPRAAT